MSALAWAAAPSPASAAAYDVESRTEAQVDTLAARSPASGIALPRRRLVEVVDLAGFELVPGEDAGLALQLRLDTDFSVNDREVADLDGVRRAAFQLVAGKLHWNGLAGGRVDVEAGRITALDPISFFRFDGARFTVRPVGWLAIGAFGGLRVTEGSWLGAPEFSPDGVRENDRRRLGAGIPAYPCAGEPSRLCADDTLDDPATTFGLRLALLQLPGGLLSGAEVEYRRTLRAGGVIEERVAGGARYRRGDWSGDAGGEWDLYVQRLTALRAGLRWAPLAWLSLAAEGLRCHPTFSADSIWNAFVSAPSLEGRLRADLTLNRQSTTPLRLYAAAGAKRYAAPDFDNAALPVPLPSAGGWEPFGAAGAGAELWGTQVGAEAGARGGVEGSQAWFTAQLRRTFRGWLGAEVRASFMHVDDKVAAKNGGDFPSAGLLLSGRLERRAQLSLLLEESSPRRAQTDVRMFAFLTLGADWDTRMIR